MQDTVRNVIRVSLILYVLIFVNALSGEIQGKDVYFRPHKMASNSMEEASYLYVWPEVIVLLQSKDGAGKYQPTIFNNNMADELDIIFSPPRNSPVNVFRDHKMGHWGLRIGGGGELRDSNRQLSDFMLNGFISCLGTLNTEELEYLGEVIYSPKSFITDSGQLIVDDEQKRLAKKMHDNYRSNACASESIDIDKHIRNQSETYINYLLTGAKNKLISADELIVWITLFKDLFFSSQGLWVKAVLANIREFAQSRLVEFPVIIDDAWLNRDYETFIDFILMTYGASEFTKSRYLNIAKICEISGFDDLFKQCPLQQYGRENKIEKYYVHIAKKRSLLCFFKGES